MQYVAWGIRFLIGAVFLAAVMGKLSSRSAFHAFDASLRAMDVLPIRWVRRVAVAVTAAEVLIVLCLAVPGPAPALAGFLLAVGLLGVFTAAIRIAAHRGTAVACRCFGASRTPLGMVHVVRNVVLAGAAAAGLLATVRGAAPVEPAPLLLSAACGVVAAALVTRLDDVVALFRSPTAS